LTAYPDFDFLQRLGWTPPLSLAIADLDLAYWRLGRVAEVARGERYRVLTEHGTLDATLPGRYRHRLDDPDALPTVGDWVVLGPGEPAPLERLLPRVGTLHRGAAGEGAERQLLCAHVNTLLIVSSLNEELNPRRLERFLAMAAEGGVLPLVVLTKTDLCADAASLVAGLQRRLGAVEVLAFSNLHDDVPALLAPWCGVGTTLAVVGSSGVGKSTLVNALLGSPRQAIGAIRDDDGKGRHTTSRRSLLALPDGGWIIDTPGLRELKLDVAPQALADVFAEVTVLLGECRFADCAHHGEPGCAVQAALDDGRLEPDRWRQYQRLQRESQAQANRREESRHQRRQRERSFGKMAREVQRGKQRRRAGLD